MTLFRNSVPANYGSIHGTVQEGGAPQPAHRTLAQKVDGFGITPLWQAACAAAVAFAAGLVYFSQQFDAETGKTSLAVPAFAAALAVAALLFAMLAPWLAKRTETTSQVHQRRILWLIVAGGLIARLLLFASEPILENDYRRYLWDGAVAAHGINPYAHSPYDVKNLGESGTLAELAKQSGGTLQRIGHKSLTTIYPPVAQSFFALAHLLEPWSLNAWRAVLLAGDLATLALLAALLREIGRSPVWVALYWLNPLVLKEGFNSAHMEPVLIPFVLAAILLAWRKRVLAASAALGLAVGIKLWPVILTPLLFRKDAERWRGLVLPGAVLGVMTAIFLAPLVFSAPAETAGLAAYAEGWNTNSALNPALEAVAARVLAFSGIANVDPALIARAFAALALTAAIFAVAWRPLATLEELLKRISIIIGLLILLSPAQYPWYLMWVLPFLVFWPSVTVLTASVTIQLYYTLFYFAAHDASDTFTNVIVWLIWVPVWAAFLYEVRRWPRAGEVTHAPG